MVAMEKQTESAKPATESTSAGILVGARDALADYCTKRHNMGFKDVLTQIVYWFVGTDPVVQRVVLGEVDGKVKKAYAEALRKMADELEAGDAIATEVPETWPAPRISEIQGGRVTRKPGPIR
jgi:hypothetical protein